ncbi:MAG: glycosyltransferase family protein, partial [Polyangiaceae bacterium]
RPGKTLWSNVLAGAGGVPTNISAYFELLKDFRPDVVISDFESWTYFYAKLHRLPVLSIDNMQIINRCVHDEGILAHNHADFQVARAFVKAKLPFCNEYFITTFFRPDIRKPKTRLFPPILRPEIASATPTHGDHLLVYQTAEGNDTLEHTLAQTGLECRIYGMKRDIKEEVVEGKLHFRPFSEAGFIADLASSRAVIAGGGFTLMGEAVYLKKPMLAVPLRRQFEQVLNARYLERAGFGREAITLNDPKVVEDFLKVVPACEKNLSTYEQDGNTELLSALDEFLDRAAAGVV